MPDRSKIMLDRNYKSIYICNMGRKTILPAQVLARARIKAPQSRYMKERVGQAASELGRMGGAAGGPARAEALTDAQRSEIAAHAANIRWGNISNYRRKNA